MGLQSRSIDTNRFTAFTDSSDNQTFLLLALYNVLRYTLLLGRRQGAAEADSPRGGVPRNRKEDKRVQGWIWHCTSSLLKAS